MPVGSPWGARLVAPLVLLAALLATSDLSGRPTEAAPATPQLQPTVPPGPARGRRGDATTAGHSAAGPRAGARAVDGARGHQQRRRRGRPRLWPLAPGLRRHRLWQSGGPRRHLYRRRPGLWGLAPELRPDGTD